MVMNVYKVVNQTKDVTINIRRTDRQNEEYTVQPGKTQEKDIWLPISENGKDCIEISMVVGGRPVATAFIWDYDSILYCNAVREIKQSVDSDKDFHIELQQNGMAKFVCYKGEFMPNVPEFEAPFLARMD